MHAPQRPGPRGNPRRPARSATPDGFVVSIKLGNDAMQSGYDVSQALQNVARRLRENPERQAGMDGGKIRDVNGNTVGTYAFADSARAAAIASETMGDGFTLVIELGNAEMQPRNVASAVLKVAHRLEQDETGGRVMDVNGNSVGNWELAYRRAMLPVGRRGNPMNDEENDEEERLDRMARAAGGYRKSGESLAQYRARVEGRHGNPTRQRGGETRSYRVLWEIDVDASSPREAAEKALEIQRDPESVATVFGVKDHPASRRVVTIDLQDANACTCPPGGTFHKSNCPVVRP